MARLTSGLIFCRLVENDTGLAGDGLGVDVAARFVLRVRLERSAGDFVSSAGSVISCSVDEFQILPM